MCISEVYRSGFCRYADRKVKPQIRSCGRDVDLKLKEWLQQRYRFVAQGVASAETQTGSSRNGFRRDAERKFSLK